jgi:predicted Zn-dependent peptidase
VSDLRGHRLTTLPSGVRVVTEAVPGVRSAALGLFIGTGSATEAASAAGWSHLLEHLLFRGTPRFASAEIDELFDAMGAELNAGTGRESTSVYSRVQDRHVERAFDVMADVVWRPALADDDVAGEQEIVLEELAMYEDDPQDLVFDLLGAATFGEHPLGRPVIGTRATVTAATSASLRAFHGERYRPGDVVVAAAGAIDHDQIVALAGAAAGDGPDRAPRVPDLAAGDVAPRRAFLERPTEQVHITLGGPGLARDDERRFALRVLDTILGGTSSSRLFQEVREKRALAYSVSSFHAQYARTGQVGLYLGTRPENVGTALQVVAAELERLCVEGIAAAELERAKEHAQGRAVLSLESMSARMSRLGGAVLAGLPVLGIDELVERVDAVRGADVDALARELFTPERLSVAAIGPSEAAFRSQLDAALPALAGAA